MTEDRLTDKQKEQALDDQDRLELNAFRKEVPNAKAASYVQFAGERKEAGRLQVFQITGDQRGIVFKEFGFLSDEAVELANKHLEQFDE